MTRQMSKNYVLNELKDEGHTYKLHNLLSIKHIVALKECFEAFPGRHMSKQMFRKTLFEIAHITMGDKDFENLCKKLKLSRSLTDISWDEVLKHLRVGLDSENLDNFSGKLELPITDAPKEFKSHHRLPITRILFIPELKNRIKNHLFGIYVTCSRDGLINYWSMDLEKQRTVFSKSPHLKSQQTWITDIVALPDVNIICTSSSERDLRFYDTTANKFELRLIITSLEYMVTAMFYTFYPDISKDSKLLIGNSAGNVKYISINTQDRGPFKSEPKMPLRSTTFIQFIKGSIDKMRITEVPTAHTDWVQQLAYYENIHSIISISTCSKQSMLIYSSKNAEKSGSYSFDVSRGFSCFAIAEELHMIITGGPDGLVRVWNPFVPSRAIIIFRGHHAWIVSITLQDDNRILISLDKDKCVKIWDVAEQVCLQSYFELSASLGERTPLCTYYNPSTRQLFVASNKIAVFKVYPLLNGDYTDGVSHTKEISVLLYNTLFKAIITCGYDSNIIIWCPWQGKRIQFIQDAHIYRMYGEDQPVGITAAAFDPSQQFLITGASDGTIKVWNFIGKTCIRNMAIEPNCEIFSIIWIPSRILVMGENRVVTEFVDSDNIGSSNPKAWVRRHQDDILCAASYPPHVIVTGSYSGELMFWRMETGQPYLMYNVANPTERISSQPQHRPGSSLKSRELKSQKLRFKLHFSRRRHSSSSRKYDKRDEKSYSDKSHSFVHRQISINVMICLTSRNIHHEIGTLLIGLDDGNIQMWSLHPAGGYITKFKATHSANDYVISMCTDEKNTYLFTGHMAGYIKTWHIVNFGIPEEDHVYVCMPKLRLQFPFLWKDTFLGRAKRAHRTNVPLLVNSFKAHLKPVTGLAYENQVQIIISCSSDYSARIWTLGGRYMGTLGTFKPWTPISPNEIADDTREYPLPVDIQRSASSTTLKVLSGGAIDISVRMKKMIQDEMRKEDDRVYGKRIDLNTILGKHFQLPVREFQHYDIVLDNSFPEVPIYSELIMPEPETIQRPPTPQLVKDIKVQTRLTRRTIYVTNT